MVQDMDMESSLKHAGAALALAFFLDHMWQERPSKRMGASPWYEAASSLACRLLAAQVSSAPQVSIPLRWILTIKNPAVYSFLCTIAMRSSNCGIADIFLIARIAGLL